MDPPSASQFDPAQHPSLAANVLLAIVVGGVAGAIGGWLMSVIAGVFFYLPILPGFAVGIAISRFCRARSVIIGMIAAFLGFAGMVFGDALTFDLVDHPGTLEYIKHFYEAASPAKVLFWGLNAGIAFWYTRDIGRVYVPVSDGVACPHCGQATPARNRFCGHCGQALNE